MSADLLKSVTSLWKLVRPQQQVKNLLIFLPAFFAIRFDDLLLFQQILPAFLSFCLAAASVYVLNDWFDREQDAAHPEKRNRPIASGRLEGRAVLVYWTFLLMCSLLLAILAGQETGREIMLLVIVYVALNAAYSIYLKQIPILDITMIGIGFVIRLLVGSFSSGVPLSPWIIIMTFLLALFLALAKRRDDVLLWQDSGKKVREKIELYNLRFLDAALVSTASVVIVAYILWSITTEIADQLQVNHLYLTSIFVVLGILRYLHLTFAEQKTSDPTLVLYRDRFIQLVLLGWFASLIWILYL